MSLRVLRLDPVKAKTGKSRSGIYEELAKPESDFSKPIRLGPKSVGWIESEVDAWLERRVAERDGRAPRPAQARISRNEKEPRRPQGWRKRPGPEANLSSESIHA